jgi:PAS domain S-box-containing protein
MEQVNFSNQRLCDLLGYPEKELMQTSWPEMTHPEDLAKDEELFNQMRDG